MARVKSFEQDVAEVLIQSGELYIPDLRPIRQSEVFGSELNDDHEKALMHGRAVVSAEFSESLQAVQGFEVYPSKTIDSQRSAHGVSFGRFTARNPNARKGIKTLVDVAVKPFDNPYDALREVQGYEILKSLGVETFTPVGIFPAESGTHFISMTQTRRDMQSLDRDNWIVGMRVDSERSAEIVERNVRTVTEISQTMAYLHANGVFHPDGQIKNWSITTDGTVGVIDTENMTRTELGSSDALTLAWDDINKLVKSLILVQQSEEDKMFGVGMFAGMTAMQARKSIEELIVIPYIDALVDNLTDEDQLKYEHIENLAESISNTFYNREPEWPQHLTTLQETAFEYA